MLRAGITSIAKEAKKRVPPRKRKAQKQYTIDNPKNANKTDSSQSINYNIHKNPSRPILCRTLALCLPEHCRGKPPLAAAG